MTSALPAQLTAAGRDLWVERACPLCGGDAESSLFAESNFRPELLDGFAFASRKLPEYLHTRLLTCSRCQLLYSNPALKPEVLADCYRDADFDSGVESGFAARTYQRVLRPLLARLPKPLTALDIGRGDGAFLKQLVSAGFDSVSGVEPSAAPLREASSDIRGNIRQGIFDPAEYPDGAFSLITCFQVMEHVPDPLSLCRGALRLLKPGGALAVIVHDREALSTKVLGTKSPIFDIEHLQLFSKASGRRLFEYAGSSDIKVSPIWNRYPVHYWLKLVPLPRGCKVRAIQLSRGLGFGNLPVPLPAGNLLLTGRRP